MNKIKSWFSNRTVYVWHSMADNPPTEEGMYLVIRENGGKRGSAHFDMFCPEAGWVQIRNSFVGSVVLWTNIPEK